MKKIILLASVITVASFASCKKAAKCECTTSLSSVTHNGVSQSLVGYTDVEVNTKEISKTSKKNAAAQCGNATDVDTQTDVSGSSTDTWVYTKSTTCAIK